MSELFPDRFASFHYAMLGSYTARIRLEIGHIFINMFRSQNLEYYLKNKNQALYASSAAGEKFTNTLN